MEPLEKLLYTRLAEKKSADDDIMMFLKSLAPKMREVPATQILDLQMEMMQLVKRYQPGSNMQSYRQSTTNQPPASMYSQQPASTSMYNQQPAPQTYHYMQSNTGDNNLGSSQNNSGFLNMLNN